MWKLNESHEGLVYTSRSMITYLAGMFSLTRRGMFRARWSWHWVRVPTIVTDGNGIEKTEGTLVFGLESQCICCRRKNRDHSLEAFWSRLATSHILREAPTPMALLLEPTTTHWEWRDGESSVYPRGRRAWRLEEYCALGWRRTASDFGKVVRTSWYMQA